MSLSVVKKNTTLSFKVLRVFKKMLSGLMRTFLDYKCHHTTVVMPKGRCAKLHGAEQLEKTEQNLYMCT